MARIETASIPCVSASVTAALVISSRECEGAGPRAARSGRSQMTPRLEPIANTVLSVLRSRQRITANDVLSKEFRMGPTAETGTTIEDGRLATHAGATASAIARNPVR